MNTLHTCDPHEEGVSTVGILVALLIVITLGLGGLSVWSYMNYSHQKNDTDAIVNTAVVAAKTAQAASDQATFLEKEKQPNLVFEGPSDFGSVTFDYPKTWSVYLGNTDAGSSGTYTAYLNPKRVPTVKSEQQFALRLKIENRSYESVLNTYTAAVKKGDLRSTVITTNGFTGTRLDGVFSKTLEGSLAIFKVRDKTLSLQTDSPSFVGDFDATIIRTLRFTL